jgi:undecaprenyl-diphosphatase
LLVVLAAAWLTMLLAHAGPFDRTIFSEIYDGGRGRIGLALRITILGSPEFLYSVLGIGAVIGVVQPHRRHGLILWLAVSLTCRLVVTIQKAAFALPRPHPSFHHVAVHSYAFPSGHSANSMATYLSFALIMVVARWRPCAVATALAVSFAVGLSRIVLGVHWPTDVLGGWVFGALWAVGGVWVAERFSRMPRERAEG